MLDGTGFVLYLYTTQMESLLNMKYQKELTIAKGTLFNKLFHSVNDSLAALPEDEYELLKENVDYWYYQYEDDRDEIIDEIINDMYFKLNIDRDRALTRFIRKTLKDYFEADLFIHLIYPNRF